MNNKYENSNEHDEGERGKKDTTEKSKGRNYRKISHG